VVVSDKEWARGGEKIITSVLIDWAVPVPQLGLEYMVHIQNFGDTAYMPNGTMGGSNQVRRIEGFAIKLTGAAKDFYTVQYQASPAGLGDTGVCSDGLFCGTRGESRALLGLRVWINAKN
jgi:hypothetical protein